MELASIISATLFVLGQPGEDFTSQGTATNGFSNYLIWISVALNVILILIAYLLYSNSKSKIKGLNETINRMNISLKDHSNKIRAMSTKSGTEASASNEKNHSREVLTEFKSTNVTEVQDQSIVVELSVENTSLESTTLDKESPKSANELNTPENEYHFANDSVDFSPRTYFASCEQENEIGYLIIEDKRSHKTPYQIQYIDGKYSFIIDSTNNNALQNAINFYNIYINPFCISSNTFRDNHKSFTAEPSAKGILEKEGERFRVVEKLNIRFLEA